MPPIETRAVTPYYQTKDDGETCRIYLGDAVDVLRSLPPRSVHMCVTSPPYYGLRKYGDDDREIGTEDRIEGYIASLVQVFSGLRRVLRNDGVLFLNLGDTYSLGNKGASCGSDPKQPARRFGVRPNENGGSEVPNGNLIGVPWRVAFALQADGWILRQDIIWDKPDPMPESVENRCTKSHEYVFVLIKSMDYYCDMEAIKEDSVDPESLNGHRARNADRFVREGADKAQTRTGFSKIEDGKTYPRRNRRSVWRIPAGTGANTGHFATFPRRLIEPMIRAGTSEHGCCPECQAPYRRIVARTPLTRERPNDYVKRNGAAGTGNSCANSVAGVETRTLGWEPGCRCGHDEVMPCTVLDPFLGSGMSAEVALDLGRNCVGIDLVEKYLKNSAVPRVRNLLLSRPDWRHLA